MTSLQGADRLQVSDLSAAMVDTKPIGFDFGQGYGDWESIGPDWTDLEASEIVEYLTNEGADIPDEYVEDPDAFLYELIDLLDDWESDSESFSPMMNYVYPLPNVDAGEGREIALAIWRASLPLCVVYLRDSDLIALALTGGGMDLSWEICEAFVVGGFLPPAHFAGNLPRMAFGEAEKARLVPVAEAAVESCRIMAGWAQSQHEHAQRSLEYVRG